eukprot:5492898-Alexandrium_andersonii.AAC.1
MLRPQCSSSFEHFQQVRLFGRPGGPACTKASATSGVRHLNLPKPAECSFRQGLCASRRCRALSGDSVRRFKT